MVFLRIGDYLVWEISFACDWNMFERTKESVMKQSSFLLDARA